MLSLNDVEGFASQAVLSAQAVVAWVAVNQNKEESV